MSAGQSESRPAARADDAAPLGGGGRRARLGTLGAVLHQAGIELGVRYGGSFFHPSEDRTVLENLILPHYQISPDHRTILFVGTEWFTHGYVRMFSHKSLVTLDLNPAKARYGASRHITASVTSIERHFGPGELDLVLLNGVLGWGLDRLDDADRAIAGCHRCLRSGGHLVIGWNDIPRHLPFRLEEIAALRRFRPHVLPSLGTSELRVANEWRHVFSFFAA